MTYCLIIEDNHISCEVLDEHMERLGFDHHVVDDPKLGLTMCLQTMPDVIILDWHMPEMDGVAFAEKLRMLENGDKPKIVLCTCDEGAKQDPNVRRMLPSAFLSKPTYFEEIERTFSELGLTA